MDKEQLVKHTVFEFLSNKIKTGKGSKGSPMGGFQFLFRDLRLFVAQKLCPEFASALDGGPYLPDEELIYLHSYINALIGNGILMQVFEYRQKSEPPNRPLFQMTPYGVKGIREGQLEPSKPTLYTLFDSLELHPWVLVASGKLFKDGYYDLAIFEACKMINNKTKDKIKDKPNRPQGKDGKALDGADLMRKVFKPKDPFLTFPPETPSAENEQEGFMNLFVGAWQALRNPKAHETPINRNPYETLHYLAFVSILAHKIEKSEVTDNGDTST